MRKYLAILFLTLLCCLGLTARAAAHELQTDGNIGAVLHIEPDDDPVVGEPQVFELYFQSLTGRFDLSSCICNLSLDKNGKTVFSHSLTAGSSTFSSIPYTFGQEGSYSLVITGQPKLGNAFDSFRLTYDIRTEASLGGTNKPLSIFTILGLILFQILVLIGLYDFFKK